MMSVGLLGLIFGVGGCGLVLGVIVLAVWAIVENRRRGAAEHDTPRE